MKTLGLIFDFSSVLQGSKNEGTDQHSLIAKMMGISRDEAKVLNYGRIYGAGAPFFIRLLQQFNPTLTDLKARKKALELFAKTKGTRFFLLNSEGEKAMQKCGDLKNIKATIDGKKIINEISMKNLVNEIQTGSENLGSRIWYGGSESLVFNELEKIATSEEPQTPVLGCRISEALEPEHVGNRFLPSRVNWVVQSSAVDYCTNSKLRRIQSFFC